MINNNIIIRGARTNNLKNINLDIPRDKFVVITGLSGSGKSSLAFDTLYAEGQRRYVESLSAYARQFVDMMDKPDVDSIEGLPAAISIDQRTAMNNPRSTVGTVSEIYDYLRLLYARIGKPHCPNCQVPLKLEKKLKDDIYTCPKCNFTLKNIEPANFSFNSSLGACPDCGGLGYKSEIDLDLIINPKLTLEQGAIKPFSHYNSGNQKNLLDEISRTGAKHQIKTDVPLKDFTPAQMTFIMKGDDFFVGVIEKLEEKYQNTDSTYLKQKISQYMVERPCRTCHGKRLKPESLNILVNGISIFEMANKNLLELDSFLKSLVKKNDFNKTESKIAAPIIKETNKRLTAINNVGLNYLNLNRSAETLSGGEAQRLRLASQIDSSLVGVLYVLDEPSIGLHQKDNDQLISSLRALRDKGNSVVVVEHDEATMLAADHLIDVGPGAGEYGGEIIFAGTPDAIKRDKNSLTGAYLSGKKEIEIPISRRKPTNEKIKIFGAKENNLKNIDVEIPLGLLVAITGVSGSGKSSLINDILARTLSRKFYRAKAVPGICDKVEGIEFVDKVIDIDQSPIGRTPRSNPATYTEVFTPIRELYASQSIAKNKGLKPAHFSFNLKGGRCEHCQGDGQMKIEMQFLPDLYIKCPECEGQRYKKEILEVKYREKNIYEVLQMTVLEALKFFKDEKEILPRLQILNDVGLKYIKLGQSATTLSGGEAQRIKLAAELARVSTGKTLYILDEPTTGLHFDDIKHLLGVLNKLAERGNSVLIIEHNLDVIKTVDWIIDMGPEGGNAGGEIVACGTPETVANVKKSWTGKYLKEIICKKN